MLPAPIGCECWPCPLPQLPGTPCPHQGTTPCCSGFLLVMGGGWGTRGSGTQWNSGSLSLVAWVISATASGNVFSVSAPGQSGPVLLLPPSYCAGPGKALAFAGGLGGPSGSDFSISNVVVGAGVEGRRAPQLQRVVRGADPGRGSRRRVWKQAPAVLTLERVPSPRGLAGAQAAAPPQSL